MTSHVDQITPIGLRAHPAVLLAQAVARLVSGVTMELRRRRAVQELHRLDDRLLADIGLVRSEITGVVRGGRRGAMARL